MVPAESTSTGILSCCDFALRIASPVGERQHPADVHHVMECCVATHGGSVDACVKTYATGARDGDSVGTSVALDEWQSVCSKHTDKQVLQR